MVPDVYEHIGRSMLFPSTPLRLLKSLHHSIKIPLCYPNLFYVTRPSFRQTGCLVYYQILFSDRSTELSEVGQKGTVLTSITFESLPWSPVTKEGTTQIWSPSIRLKSLAEVVHETLSVLTLCSWSPPPSPTSLFWTRKKNSGLTVSRYKTT